MRINVAAALLAALLAPAAHAAQPASQAKESLQELQGRIESLKQELDRTEGAHADATDALKQSERAISESNRKLLDLGQQQKARMAALDSIHKDRSGLEATIATQQKLLSDQLYRQYVNGEQNYLRALLDQRDPSAIERDLYYLGYVSRARARLIDDLRHNLGRVARLDAETADALQQISQLKNDQEQARRDLQKQQTDRKQVLSKLSAQIKSQRGEIEKLKRDEKRLSQLVEKLSRIVPKSPKKSVQIKEKESTPAEEKAQRNEVLPAPVSGGGAFAALKGKLRLPVRGDVTNHFGATRADSGVSWKGLFIRTQEGETVHSIANGRIVFADWLRGFGNLIIVDHGDGYMSLYGNNQTLLKKVGEEVNAGDAIAAAGNSGGNPESGVYFEIRYLSKPFDPLSWCVVR